MTPLQALLAREEIRQLVLRYSSAIAERDIDLMVSLYVDDASFGLYGKGPQALRRMMESTMADLQFGVILVANHRIEFDSDHNAHGEVWARCHGQNEDGYYEQLIKYVDRYRLMPSSPDEPDWRFEFRKQLMWFGEARESPLAQAPANWPDAQIGVGRIPLADPVVLAWREGLEDSDDGDPDDDPGPAAA